MEMRKEQPAIEQVREYWDNRPCNIRHSSAEVGTRQYFDEVEKRKYFVEPHIPGFAQFSRWKGKKVLEIGMGIGTDAVVFARAGADYTGIELSEKSLDIARKRFKVYGLKGQFHHGNAECLSDWLPYQKYDLVYSFGVLHHTPSPAAAVWSIRKYMHEDSEFRLMLYAFDSWKRIMVEAGLDQFEAQAGCPVAGAYSRGNVYDLLSSRGYQVLEMRQTHIFPYNVEAYKQYRYEREPWFKAMLPAVFDALEKELGWHLLITCKLT